MQLQVRLVYVLWDTCAVLYDAWANHVSDAQTRVRQRVRLPERHLSLERRLHEPFPHARALALPDNELPNNELPDQRADGAPVDQDPDRIPVHETFADADEKPERLSDDQGPNIVAFGLPERRADDVPVCVPID